MYLNPWIRKHSTIRQVIDKLLSINTNNTKKFDAMLNKKKNGSNRTASTATDKLKMDLNGKITMTETDDRSHVNGQLTLSQSTNQIYVKDYNCIGFEFYSENQSNNYEYYA